MKKILVSVSIREDQKEWLDENGYSLSKLVQRFLDKKMGVRN